MVLYVAGGIESGRIGLPEQKVKATETVLQEAPFPFPCSLCSSAPPTPSPSSQRDIKIKTSRNINGCSPPPSPPLSLPLTGVPPLSDRAGGSQGIC